MADIAKSFRTNSISLNNSVAIFEGNLDPRTNDQGNLTAVPQGTIYIRTNGELYQKTGTGNLDFSLITSSGSAVSLLDTDLSNTLTLVAGSNLTSDRILTLITADANQTLTITGSPTINDWFDQNVKTTASPTFAQVDGGNLRITGNTLSSTDTNGHVKIDPDGIGGVGIGLGGLNPAAKLHVSIDGSLFSGTNSGTVATFQKVTAANANIGVVSSNTGTCSFDFGDTDLRNPGSVVYNHSTNEMAFNANAVEVMRLYPSKRVTIGNTNSSTSAKLYVYASGTPVSYFSDSVLVLQRTALGDNARLALTGSSTGLSILDMGDEGDQRTQNITCSNVDNSMRFSTNLIERMRIDSSGNVGIGTTNVPAKLTTLLSGSISTTNITSNVASFQKTDGQAEVSIIGSTTTASVLYFGDTSAGTSGGIIYGHDADYMYFRTNFSERMRIDSSGNVGIGTTAPSTPLHVLSGGTAATGSASVVSIFQRSATGNSMSIELVSSNTGSTTLGFGDTDNLQTGKINYSHSSNNMTFTTNSSEAMRIDSSGNVGIGTTTPLGLLHIDGRILNTWEPLKDKLGFNDYLNGVIIDGKGSDYWTILDNSIKYQSFGVDHNHTSYLYLGASYVLPQGYTGTITYSTNLTSGIFSIDLEYTTDYVTWISMYSSSFGSDNASIALSNITTPRGLRFKFVRGNGTASSAHTVHSLKIPNLNTSIVSSATGTSKFLETNVGIGTTTPSIPLDVVKGGTPFSTTSPNVVALFQNTAGFADIQIVSANTSASSVSFGDIDGLSRGSVTYDHATEKMDFRTGGVANRMVIDSSGNVMIGATSALLSAQLSVVSGGTTTMSISRGTTTFDAGIRLLQGSTQEWFIGTGTVTADSSLDLYDGIAGVSRLRIDPTGNVGIGTTAPNRLLEISGTSATSIFRLKRSDNATASSGIEFVGSDNIIDWHIGANQTISGNLLTLGGNLGGTQDWLRIDTSGNVGIGVNPTQKLTVAGVIESTTGGIKFPDATVQTTASTANLWTDNAPNINYTTGTVSIGTTTASSKLLVRANGSLFPTLSGTTVASFEGTTGDASISIISNSTGQSTLNFGDNDSENPGSILYNNSSDKMGFYTSASERVTIDSSGNVGIGVNPTVKLDVNGTINASSLTLSTVLNAAYGGTGVNLSSNNILPYINIIGRLSKWSAQSINATTITTITNWNNLNTTGNITGNFTNGTFTINQAGGYWVNSSIFFTSSQTNGRIFIYKNGSQVAYSWFNGFSASVSYIVSASVNDIIDIRVFTNTSSTIDSALNGNFFHIRYMSKT